MSKQIYLISSVRIKTGSAFNTTTRTCKQAGTAKSESHTVGTPVSGSLARFKEWSTGEAEPQNKSMSARCMF